MSSLNTSLGRTVDIFMNESHSHLLSSVFYSDTDTDDDSQILPRPVTPIESPASPQFNGFTKSVFDANKELHGSTFLKIFFFHLRAETQNLYGNPALNSAVNATKNFLNTASSCNLEPITLIPKVEGRNGPIVDYKRINGIWHQIVYEAIKSCQPGNYPFTQRILLTSNLSG
ncbi:hypothetical protein GEMRC1_013589 [Eukaryota sp. GEM-RC1]